MGTVGTIMEQNIATQIPNNNTGIHGIIVESLIVEFVSIYIIKLYVKYIKVDDPINKNPLLRIFYANIPNGITNIELTTYGNARYKPA
jgi:hypothetical protein